MTMKAARSTSTSGSWEVTGIVMHLPVKQMSLKRSKILRHGSQQKPQQAGWCQSPLKWVFQKINCCSISCNFYTACNYITCTGKCIWSATNTFKNDSWRIRGKASCVLFSRGFAWKRRQWGLSWWLHRGTASEQQQVHWPHQTSFLSVWRRRIGSLVSPDSGCGVQEGEAVMC